MGLSQKREDTFFYRESFSVAAVVAMMFFGDIDAAFDAAQFSFENYIAFINRSSSVSL